MKKGLPPLAKYLVGVVALVLVAALVLAAARVIPWILFWIVALCAYGVVYLMRRKASK